MSNTEKRRWSLFPKTLESCIEPLTRPVLKAQGLAGSRILTEWENIVGSSLASHCMPEKLSFPPGKKTGGTLTISVESGFATELQHMQHIIMERMASYFGYQAITRISISHSWVKTDDSAPLPPLPAVLPKNSASMTQSVEDPELRKVLESFANTLSGNRT